MIHSCWEKKISYLPTYFYTAVNVVVYFTIVVFLPIGFWRPKITSYFLQSAVKKMSDVMGHYKI